MLHFRDAAEDEERNPANRQAVPAAISECAISWKMIENRRPIVAAIAIDQ